MGSAPVGVRRHLDQTLTTFSGHRCLAQLLEWGLSPFDDNVQLFPVRSTPPFRAIHSPEHQLLNHSALVHSTYESEQSQFYANQFLHDVLLKFYSTVSTVHLILSTLL